jgi:hypothetical protein
MLIFLNDTRRAPGLSDRKERLFACACCRRIWERTAAPGRLAIEAAEAYADGRATLKELERAHDAAWEAMGEEIPGFGLRTPKFHPINAAWYTCAREDSVCMGYASAASSCCRAGLDEAAMEAEKMAQAGLLRDIAGNPFRPASIGIVHRTPVVIDLAQAAYRERSMPGGELDTVRLAVLADALEEAGCTDTKILRHLRGPGPHVRGCFVVDLLMESSQDS